MGRPNSSKIKDLQLPRESPVASWEMERTGYYPLFSNGLAGIVRI